MSLIEQMALAKSSNDYHRRLLQGDIPDPIKPFGISFFMLGVPFKEISERYSIVHVTEGLTKEQVEMMNFGYASTLEDAIRQTHRKFPKAEVTILPSGGTIVPVVSG